MYTWALVNLFTIISTFCGKHWCLKNSRNLSGSQPSNATIEYFTAELSCQCVRHLIAVLEMKVATLMCHYLCLVLLDLAAGVCESVLRKGLMSF